MDELFKKFLYTGVGLASLTAEKLQETVDEMVGKGKVSKDEGKKIVDEFIDRVDDQRSDFEKRMREMADNLSASINLPKMATKEDIENVLSRLEALEAKVNGATTEKVQAAVEKTAAQAEEAVAQTKTTARKTATRAKKTTTK